MAEEASDLKQVPVDLNKILQLSDILHRRWLDSPESRDLSDGESMAVVIALLCRMAHVSGTPAEVMAANVMSMSKELDSMRRRILLPTGRVH